MHIKSDRIYTESGVKSGYLTIENGRFGPVESTPPDSFIDYGRQRIIPGIFDTHNHGVLGYSLIGSEDAAQQKETIRGYLKGCASQGITSIFPTADLSLFSALADAAETPPEGAQVVGIHSEGPWLNRTGEKGVWTPWPEVSLDVAKKMVADCRGHLKLVALAPEIEGIDEVAEYFLAQGITLAFAHSDDNYQQANDAFNNRGFSVATHTGNVMTGLHHRDIGGLGAALLNDKVDCEIICDGMHVCLDMLRVYFKLKDTSRFMMISDCTPFSGAPAGTYAGFFPGMVLEVKPDGFVLSDTGRLMGSSQPVLYGIGNLVEKLGLPLETVVQMASLNPCRKYGLDKEKGSIAPGKDADFAVISDDYKAVVTYVKGRKVFDMETDTGLFNPAYLDSVKA